MPTPATPKPGNPATPSPSSEAAKTAAGKTPATIAADKSQNDAAIAVIQSGFTGAAKFAGQAGLVPTTGDRYVAFVRLQVGDKVFNSGGGDFIVGVGTEPYLKNSSTQHNELRVVLNDESDELRLALSKETNVDLECGFVDGPKMGVFTGKVYEIGRHLPFGTVLIAVDPSYDLGNMIQSAVIPNSTTGTDIVSSGGSPTSASFDRVIKFVQKWEGDGAAGAADLGGKTRFGVTQSLWRSLGKPEPQTKEAAAAIFKEIYWDGGPRCSQYQDPLAAVCFDTSVNFGPHGNGTRSQGWKSLSAGLNLAGDPVGAARTVIQRRLAWRETMAQRIPSQRAFVKGWQRRDNDLLKLVNEIAASAPPKAPTNATATTTPAGATATTAPSPGQPVTAPKPATTPEAQRQADTLAKQQAATAARTDNKPAPPPAQQAVEKAGAAVNVNFSNRSAVDTGGAGKVQAQQSPLQQAVVDAQSKGDAVAVRGNTLEQVSPGNEKSSGVVINYATARDLFIDEPVIVKRTGMQLKSGFGAMTVAGFSVNGKESVGATVVTTAPDPAAPSGPIVVPEWGAVKAGDPIYPGSLYTWGDATKNMSRPPGRGDSGRSPKQIMENIVKIARVADDLSKRFKGGQKLRISSWYRDPASNRAAGGASGSRHMWGDAIDITDPVFPTIFNTLRSEGWHKSKGGLAISPGSFCHVDLGDPRTWTYG